jgi:DNA-binding winged helix-turn-helix (wHTH) protein/tetratricopeptide (TPR) repeat protein
VRGAPPVLRFGVFELNLAREELRKFGTLIKLAPQPFKLLALLASQAGEIVTREQIQFQLWGEETFVDFEQGMNHCIRQIRNALSDEAETPRYIETLPRRGYRFVAPVEAVMPAVDESLLTVAADRPVKVTSSAIADTSGSQAAAAALEVSPLPADVSDAMTRSLSGPSWRKWLAAVLFALAAMAAVGAYRMFRGRDIQQSALSSPDLRHRRTVAVLGFKNLAGHPDTGIPLSIALTTMLGTELAAGDYLRVVPSAEVERLKLETHLGDADSLPSDMLRRIQRTLGADYVVLGSYLEENGQLRVDLRVQDTMQGDIVASVAEDGTNGVTALAGLVSNAGASIRPRLGVPEVSQDEISGIRATRPGDTAAEYYYQGLAKLRAFDALAARELLEKAVAAEPDFAPAHLGLAEALSRLGYSKLARGEAEKAFDSSSTLPTQERLLIEGRYRELTSKWEQAIALYKKLWDSAQNNVDYGLYLAAAQTKAGKGQDALATLRALRALPQPERDDLRIDLEEAEADYTLGEYDHEQTAADLAARKAEALGGGFALARARKAQGKSLFYRGHLDEAVAMYRQSQAISQVLGDKGEFASSSNNIASVLKEQGNLSAANQLYATALEGFRAIGNQRSAAAAMSNMGAVYQLEGELADARKMYLQALDICRELEDRMNEGIITNNLGEVSLLTGNLATARQKHEQALMIYRQIKNSSSEAEALFGIGQVLAAEGDLAASRRSHEKALGIRTQLNEEEYVPESRVALAAIAMYDGNAGEAESTARTAAEVFHKMKLRDKQVGALILLARSLLAQGKEKEAAQVLAQAKSLASEIQNRILLLDLELASAQVMSRDDNPRQRAEANQKLGSIISDSEKRQCVQIQLEATLALAESEIRSGSKSAGKAQLSTLRKQASARGFGLIARQAAAAEKRV